jgi:hypothetical protein
MHLPVTATWLMKSKALLRKQAQEDCKEGHNQRPKEKLTNPALLASFTLRISTIPLN